MLTIKAPVFNKTVQPGLRSPLPDAGCLLAYGPVHRHSCSVEAQGRDRLIAQRTTPAARLMDSALLRQCLCRNRNCVSGATGVVVFKPPAVTIISRQFLMFCFFQTAGQA